MLGTVRDRCLPTSPGVAPAAHACMQRKIFKVCITQPCRRPCLRREPRSRSRRPVRPALARRRGAPAPARTYGGRQWATPTGPCRVDRAGPTTRRLASSRNRRLRRRPDGSSRRLPRSGTRLHSSRRSLLYDSRRRRTWTPHTRHGSATHAASTTSPPTESHMPRPRLVRAPHRLPRLRLARAPDDTRLRLARAPRPATAAPRARPARVIADCVGCPALMHWLQVLRNERGRAVLLPPGRIRWMT